MATRERGGKQRWGRRLLGGLVIGAGVGCSSPSEMEVSHDHDGAEEALEAGEAELALEVAREMREHEGATTEGLLLEARALRQLRRFREALATLDEIEDPAASSAEVVLLRVDTLRSAGRASEALDRLQPLISDEDPRPEYVYRRGELHHAMGLNEEALADFAQARAQAPDWWEPLCAEVAVLLLEGRVDDARRSLDEAEELVRAHAPLAHHRALVAEAEADDEAALGWYALAIERDADHWPSQLNRAGLLERKGLRDEALHAYQKSLEALPAADIARRRAIKDRVTELRGG